jgi:hypothetical protein
MHPREQRPHTFGGAVEAIGQDASNPIGRLLLGCHALKLLIRLGISRRTGGLGIAQMPENTATGDRRQIDLLGEAMTVLFIGQEIDGQGQTTSCQDRHQTLLAKGTDQAIEGHGRNMGDDGAEFQAEAPMCG